MKTYTNMCLQCHSLYVIDNDDHDKDFCKRFCERLYDKLSVEEKRSKYYQWQREFTKWRHYNCEDY